MQRRTTTPVDEEDRRYLEEFASCPDLKTLESILDRCNVFEAVGMVRQELRHSKFLAFLFDPRQPHGLGDLFSKRFLRHTLTTHQQAELPISLSDLDVWNLDGIYVRREWNNIDLLLVSEVHGFVVVIENKVGASEHGDQLSRYHRTLRQHYPGYRVLALFLTPDGADPSNPDYLPISYRLIVTVIEQLLEQSATILRAETGLLLRHYADLLRTHVMSNPEIDSLCQRIYQDHGRALELIFERRPDRQADIRDLVKQLIGETKGDLLLDCSTKSYIRFLPREWDTPVLKQGNGWTPSGRMLMFSLHNLRDIVQVVLAVCPGPELVRTRLVDLAIRKGQPFRATQQRRSKFETLYSRQIITPPRLDTADIIDIRNDLKAFWRRFVDEDLSVIRKAVEEERWIWEQVDDNN